MRPGLTPQVCQIHCLQVTQYSNESLMHMFQQRVPSTANTTLTQTAAHSGNSGSYVQRLSLKDKWWHAQEHSDAAAQHCPDTTPRAPHETAPGGACHAAASKPGSFLQRPEGRCIHHHMLLHCCSPPDRILLLLATLLLLLRLALAVVWLPVAAMQGSANQAGPAAF